MSVSKRSSYRLNPLSQRDCEKGDHLYVHRFHKRVIQLVFRQQGYTHHGIYIGDGKVVEFFGLSSGYVKGPIRIVDLETFAGNFPIYRWSYDSYREKKYAPDEIVLRALSQVGKRDYNVAAKNCENFANWCVTGRSICRQVPIAVQKTVRHFHSWRFNDER